MSKNRVTNVLNFDPKEEPEPLPDDLADRGPT